MRIEFPLLSILSLAVLLFFGLQGDVELYSWEVGANITPDEVRVTVDPTIAIWVDSLYDTTSHCGYSLGGIMVMDARYRQTEQGNHLTQHEFNHARQQRALGLWFIPASFFLNLEGEPYYLQGRPYDERFKFLARCNARMWQPPFEWPNQWGFLTLAIAQHP